MCARPTIPPIVCYSDSGLFFNVISMNRILRYAGISVYCRNYCDRRLEKIGSPSKEGILFFLSPSKKKRERKTKKERKGKGKKLGVCLSLLQKLNKNENIQKQLNMLKRIIRYWVIL